MLVSNAQCTPRIITEWRGRGSETIMAIYIFILLNVRAVVVVLVLFSFFFSLFLLTAIEIDYFKGGNIIYIGARGINRVVTRGKQRETARAALVYSLTYTGRSTETKPRRNEQFETLF